MQNFFAPSLLRALVSRNVLVSVLALVVVVVVAIYESNDLILSQFADESAILADVAQNEIFDQADLAQRAASLFASIPTTPSADYGPRNQRRRRLIPSRRVSAAHRGDLSGVFRAIRSAGSLPARRRS